MIMMVVYIIMMVEFILSPVIGWEVTGEAAGREDWELNWYIGILAPIENPWMGREGMPMVVAIGKVWVMGSRLVTLIRLSPQVQGLVMIMTLQCQPRFA
jgi:hypothetical protein